MLLDVHGHPPHDPALLPGLLAALERFDSRLLLSDLGSRHAGWEHDPEVAHWREGNERCAALVHWYPDRFLGYCYVNPAHGREALAEMERRLLGERQVFAALKLWVAVRCSDPRLDPLMEFCAAYGVPVLQHTWMKVGPGGPGAGNLPGESTPVDLLALAQRHPRVRFFGGHTGGDWEWGVAALKQVDNVWLDVAGGDATGGYMAAALRAVGAGRIVYGTDVCGRSVPSQLAKVLGAGLPDDDAEKILWRNAVEVLGERLPVAWREHFLGPPPTQAEGAVAARGASAGAGGSPVPPTPPVGGGAPVRGAPPGSAALDDTAPGGGARISARWAAGRVPRIPAPRPGGYVDASAFLGEWPGRRLNGSPPPPARAVAVARREDMDRLDIRRQAVSLLEGVWLKDSAVANAELHALVLTAPRRFFPVYTVNPAFPAWEEHLERCRREYALAPGRGAVRLSPGYHGYRLDAPAVDACLARLVGLDLPVLLTWQLEDARIQGPAMQVPDLDPEAVLALAARWPDVRLIVTGAVQSQALATGRRLPPGARVWFDLARVQGPVDGIPALVRAIGAQRLLFGTGLPLQVAESPILELADAVLAGLPPEVDTAIRHGNARAALGLEA